MKILAAFIMVLAWPLSACCAPFLASDPPESAVESCVFDGLDLACTLAPDGAIRTDLAALPSGAYTVKAKYCIEKGLWCSDWSSPFAFTKPALTPPPLMSLSR